MLLLNLWVYCKFMNFIAKLWRGEVSLGITYWIFGGVVLSMFKLFTLVTQSMNEDSAGFGIFAGLAYFVFISVAIWRSSLRYPGPKIWMILAQLTVVGGVFNYLWIFFL